MTYNLNRQLILEYFFLELEYFKIEKKSAEKWRRLERMHIIGQSYLKLHFYTHICMLRLAIKEIKIKEILGQLIRLLLLIPGHITGRLPEGNVGTTRVNAFITMHLPEELMFLYKNK